jgi:hypothetical protein
MGYNQYPKWTKEIVLPDKHQMTCPNCGQVAGNVDEIFREHLEGGYYSARHIPPTLTFTCFNPLCPKPDMDFSFRLSVIVTAVHA